MTTEYDLWLGRMVGEKNKRIADLEEQNRHLRKSLGECVSQQLFDEMLESSKKAVEELEAENERLRSVVMDLSQHIVAGGPTPEFWLQSGDVDLGEEGE